MNHIYLIGFMGAGKSSVGRELAGRRGISFIDVDDRIEEQTGTSIRAIFEADGEEAFRAIERGLLERIAEEPAAVVACGGGIVISDLNRATLKRSGTVVYLQVEAAQALARIGDTETRPLLSGGGGGVAATALLKAREALYEAVSDIVVDTAGRSVSQVADEVLIALDEAGRR